jgi:hypothetical protein
MIRLPFGAGEMSLIPRHSKKWFRNEDLHGLCIAFRFLFFSARGHGPQDGVRLDLEKAKREC